MHSSSAVRFRFSTGNPSASAFFQVLEGDAPCVTMVVTDLHRL
jgi:hypothetical protein